MFTKYLFQYLIIKNVIVIINYRSVTDFIIF